MRVAALSFTPIASDHRVLRTIAALVDAGHAVTALGFGEAPPLACDFVRLPSIDHPMLYRASLVLTQAPANLLPASATALHFSLPQHRAARRALMALRPDIVHANDAAALPSAVALRRATGAHIVYDSHEFASEEHLGNARWRLVSRRHVSALEARHIGEVDRIITVSDGIAEALQQLYSLPALPAVVRNTPAYREIAPRPAGNPIRLLFHGILKAERGIEECIDALALLPGGYVLTLRGNGAPAYLAGLRERVARLGLTERVAFTPAVPNAVLIEKASEHDIGLFCAPTQSRHNRFAMPNKVFEYMMAGLAVVVSAGTELADLVLRHGCGVTADGADPAAIATAIQSLDQTALAAARAGSLRAARQLCWESERERLLALYRGLATA